MSSLDSYIKQIFDQAKYYREIKNYGGIDTLQSDLYYLESVMYGD